MRQRDPAIDMTFTQLMENLDDADGRARRAQQLDLLIFEATDILAKLDQLLAGVNFTKQLSGLRERMTQLCADAAGQAEIRKNYNREIGDRLLDAGKSGQLKGARISQIPAA
jgi:SLT domain-containing protein